MPAAIDPAAFAAIDRTAPVVALGGATMGTTWSVRYVAPAGMAAGVAAGVAAATVRQAIVARLDDLVAQMSHWAPDSWLSRFNRAPPGTWMVPPRDAAAVLAVADAVARGAAGGHAGVSAGAFDPAIGRLVDLWGFGPPGAMPVPDAAAIAAARGVSGWHRLAYDRLGEGARARLRQPGGVALDLSGIAKGHAADAVAAVLAAHGIRHALAEVGGELVGCGVRPDLEPWWVDLEAPPGCDLPPLRVALHGLAVATSGHYRRGDHALDPRSGRPAANGVAAVSVIASSALLADALATAIMVGWRAGDALPADAAAARIVWIADGAVHETLSPALAAMLG